MKCILLELSNFMGIGEIALDLADKGLVAIQGINLDDTSADSNGSGKSSLADGIFWNTYGETARDNLGADEVVNRKTGKNTLTKSVWQDDAGDTYTITRWRKHNINGKKNGLSLTHHDPVTGIDTDLTKGTDKLTQVEIDKALGCDREVFAAAVYAGQEKLPNLPAMTDGELKQLIEKAAGIDVLVTAYRIARDRLKDADNAQSIWRADHGRLERDVTNSNTRVNELTASRDGYEAKRKNNLGLLTDQLREHVGNAKKRQVERDSIDEPRIQSEIKKLDAKIASVEGERLEEENLLADEREAVAKQTTVQAHFNRAKQDAFRQKEEVANIASRVGQPCTECGKECEEHDIEVVRERAKEQLRLLAAKAFELKDDLAEQTAVAERRSKSLAEHRAARTDVSAVVDERRRFADLLAQRNRFVDSLTSETQAALRVKAQMDALQAEANPFVTLVDKAAQELEDSAKAFRESEEAGVGLEKRVQVCREVVKVYGPAGVRAHVLDTVTPFLNARTADYLGALSDGNISAVWSTLSVNAKGEMVEKFAIAVEKNTGGGSFASLSGGEKRKVRLSCALALQDLVASRANKPIEVMVYDEVDTALDTSGLERLMNVFEQKGRDRGTVIIISHNDINDFVRNVATVTMQGGMSTIDPGILAVV